MFQQASKVAIDYLITWLLCIVGLDVHRTDRALEFYETEANQAKLFDVLAVYAWLDNDIGYVQGNLLCLIFICWTERASRS